MKKSEKLVIGNWRITGMEVWDAGYFVMKNPDITVRNNLACAFHFDLVQGDIEAYVGNFDGVARVEFSWAGADENDPISGRG